MEILTLLKADIKKKKGTFLSIAFLMVIISAVMTSLISVKDNYQNAVKAALKGETACDVRLYFPADELTDEMRSVLESAGFVSNVEYFDFLCPDSLKKDGNDNYNRENLQTARSGLKFYKDDFSGLESGPRTIQDGEIYIPLGHKFVYQCEIGDKFTADIGDRTYDFTLKGFVEEPMGGASGINGSRAFISAGDFHRMTEECKTSETAEKSPEAVMVCIDKSESYNGSASKLARSLTQELKEKTGYTAIHVFTGDEAYKYTVMTSDILINIALVFAAFLFVIVLVVMSHSIGAEIEMDYITIGILKAQGFGSGKIRALFIWRYLLAQSVGIIAGCIVAVPIERAVSKICMLSTGIFPNRSFSVGKAGLLMLAIIIICTVLILIRTRKAVKISPVRAISGGRDEIYFNSRLHAPISKKALSASLALRQITSGFGRYVGVIMIVCILTFFMITVKLIGNIMSSKTMLAAIGVPAVNLEMRSGDGTEKSAEETEAAIDEAERFVDGKDGVVYKLYYNTANLFYEGDSIFCHIYKYPEQIDAILKGRAPRYDNEMLITEIIADAYDLKIGDKMRLAYKENEEEFIVTGFFQSTNDAGRVLGLSFEGADKLGVLHNNLTLGYMFDDLSELDDIKRELDERFGGTLQTTIYESIDDMGGIAYTALINALQAFIYLFSAVFAFIVMRMVVSKAFVRERTDIGIYKAVGFNANKLRLSFAVRFMMVTLIGAALGAVLSAFASEIVLSFTFRIIGVSKVFCDFTVLTIVLPVIFMGIAFFVFSFLASGKIRKVQIRELVTE